MKKYCFAASMGGHLEEVACLKEIAKECESFLLTEKGGFQEIRFCNRTRYVLQINRKEKTFLFKFICDKHRISKTKETIFVFHCNFVSIHYVFVSRKGRNQHKQSAFG